MRLAKMAFEPQRYHFVMFEHLYKSMTSSDYKQDCIPEEFEAVDKKGKKGKDKKVKKADSDDEALSVAKELNGDKSDGESPIKQEKSAKSSSSSSSSESDKESSSDLDDESLCASELSHRRVKRRDAKNSKMTFH